MTIIYVPPAPSPPGELVWEWIDPFGVVRNLSSFSAHVGLEGLRGLGMMAPDLDTEKLPFSSGEVDRHAGIGKRVIELPVLFRANTWPELETLMDQVHGWFHTADETRRRRGILRVTRSDGTKRQVECYYTGGLQGDLSRSVAGHNWQKHVIELTAVNPWAMGIEDIVTPYDIGPSAQFTVINDGQLDAYPIWTVNGPLLSMTFANHSVARSWTLNASIATGTSVTIDTRPASDRTTPRAVDSSGADQSGGFTGLSDLWALGPSNNSIDIALANFGFTTHIVMRYRPLFRSMMR